MNKYVTRHIKITFTDTEKLSMGQELSNAIRAKTVAEAEFDQVKASFKSRIAEQEATVARISTDLSNGWAMRQMRLFVVLRPKDGKKDMYQEGSATCVLTEDMTQDDYQMDLEEVKS